MPATTNSTIAPMEAVPTAKAAAIATGAITNARTARSRLPMFLMRYLLAIVRSFRWWCVFDWKDEYGSGGDTPARRRARRLRTVSAREALAPLQGSSDG